MRFNERLRGYFKDNHLNQSSVARDMHIDVSKLNAVINGKRKMDIEEFEIFCKVVNASPLVFLNHDGKFDEPTNKF